MKRRTEIRHGRWLARGVGPKKTIVFIVCVQIERNPRVEGGDGAYVSTLLGLEPGTVTASGATPDEAESNAIVLFKVMVDHVLKADPNMKTSRLRRLVGKSAFMRVTNVNFREVKTLQRSIFGLAAEVKKSPHGPALVAFNRGPRRSSAIRKPWLTGDESQVACG